MEFIVTDKEGKILNPPPRPDEPSSKDLFNIRIVDVRLTFRSNKPFYRDEVTGGANPRLVKGIGDRTREFFDRFLRDSVVVSVHTRNIGSDL